MLITAYILSFLCLLLNLSLFVRLKPPYSFYFVLFQLAAGALAPILIMVGSLGALLGWLSGTPIAFVAGILGTAVSVVYMVRVTKAQPDLAETFGTDWEAKIPPAQAARLLKRRWQPGLPRQKTPMFEQDIPFCTIPGTDRELLCDIWQPHESIERSGLAIVFLHGSAWYMLDKDTGTRPLFTQLTAQGQVIMDVAYRLTPEVDIVGMVGDVKRAVAWMKENAERYGVKPNRVVLAGGSAGGHLSLLAAYTAHNAQLTPSELANQDLSVHAVASFYGPTDLRACYDHLGQERLMDMPKVEIGLPGAATMEKTMVDAGRLDMLLGGHLHEVPEMYALASPVTHVSPDAPPTLLVQGEPDVIAPITATRELYSKLIENGVTAVNIVYPLTDHAFDLILPHISPPAQSAIYYLERFLALMTYD